jgi:glutaredoxin
MISARAVTLYSRAGCHLCAEAEAVLRSVQRQATFELTIIDVDRDLALADRYGVRVPVVAVDGVERFEFEVPRSDLLEALGAAEPAPQERRAAPKRRFWRR